MPKAFKKLRDKVDNFVQNRISIRSKQLQGHMNFAWGMCACLIAVAAIGAPLLLPLAAKVGLLALATQGVLIVPDYLKSKKFDQSINGCGQEYVANKIQIDTLQRAQNEITGIVSYPFERQETAMERAMEYANDFNKVASSVKVTKDIEGGDGKFKFWFGTPDLYPKRHPSVA